MRSKMQQDPVGQLILKERPRVLEATVDLKYLRSLPRNTFGAAYVGYIDENGCVTVLPRKSSIEAHY